MLAPQWTAHFSSNNGEDQLGLEGAAQGYQQVLIPGVITTTDHARYYSFYSWVLYRFIHVPNSSRLLDDLKGPYFKRHEVAYILACYSHHKDRGGLPGIIGAGNNNSNARRIWQTGDPVSLDEHYFTHKLGGLGQYYRPAMQEMGLVGEPIGPKWVYPLTERGKELAEAFQASIAGTAYLEHLTHDEQLAALSHEAALEYGTRACLCAESLNSTRERQLLLHTFFRIDRAGQNDAHMHRRLTLGVLLELVAQSGTIPFKAALRPALYLREYAEGQAYGPDTRLADWSLKWRLTQMRHSYTSALQALWAVFLDHLRANPDRGISFMDFMEWVGSFLPAEVRHATLPEYLGALCNSVGLSTDWAAAHSDFDTACRKASGKDEHTLYRQITSSDREPEVLVPRSLEILCRLFLRFHSMHVGNSPIWREVAHRPRQPVAQFFDELHSLIGLRSTTVADTLALLYREYILGQHELVALEKLRYSRYNTLKFHYQDGLFTWAYNPPDYREPLRYPTLRLRNALTILIDLGLIVEDESGVCRLTPDGEKYLQLVLEAAGNAT